MPLDGFSPMARGMLNALSIGNALQQMTMQQEAFERAKRNEVREQQMQDADLQIRLNALGARPATSSDDLEEQTGLQFSEAPAPGGLGVLRGIRESDIKGRLLKVAGKKYVLPTIEEQDQRQTERDNAKATATAKARGQAETDVQKARLEQLGIKVSDEDAQAVGLPTGTRIMPEHLDDYFRALSAKRAASVPGANPIMHAFAFQRGNDVVIATVDRGGKVGENIVKGAQKNQPRGGGVTADRWQQAQEIAEGANEALDAAGGDPEAAEAKLGELAATNPKIRQHRLEIVKQLRGARAKPKSLTQMTPDELAETFDKVAGGDEKKPAAPTKKAAAPVAPVKTGANAQSYIDGLKKRKASAR